MVKAYLQIVQGTLGLLEGMARYAGQFFSSCGGFGPSVEAFYPSDLFQSAFMLFGDFFVLSSAPSI